MINADKKKEMKNLSEMLLETRNLTRACLKIAAN